MRTFEERYGQELYAELPCSAEWNRVGEPEAGHRMAPPGYGSAMALPGPPSENPNQLALLEDVRGRGTDLQ